MLKLLERLNRALAHAEMGLLMLLIAALTLILSAQVILRYFFNSPLFWAEEVSVQILISCTFIGLSYLTYTDNLVRIDFLIDHLPPEYRNYLNWALNLVGFLTLALLCYHATDWIMRPEIKADISPTTGLPRWYNYSVLVVAFYLMAWHLLVKLILHKNYEPHHSHSMQSSSEVEESRQS